MLLQKLQLNPFACFSRQTVNFGGDLNLIYGPNEAGKSTIMSALEIALFMSLNYRKNSSQHDFVRSKFPRSGGDHFSLELEASHQDQDIKLRKTFYKDRDRNEAFLSVGESEYADGEKIEDLLAGMLGFGRETYQNSVMINQGLLGRTISRLQKTDNSSLEETLRRAVFETEGLSLQALSQKLENKLAEINQHWNFEQNMPETPASSDRYAPQNRGRILQLYYQKEDLKQQKRKLEQLSELVDDKNRRLTEVSEKIEKCNESLERLQELRDNWNRFQEYKDFKDKMGDLEKMLKHWHEYQSIFQEFEDKVAEYEKAMAEKKEEIASLKEAREYAKDSQLKDKIEELSCEKSGLEEKLKECPRMSAEELEEMRASKAEISEIESRITSSQLSASVELLGDGRYEVRKGLEDETTSYSESRDLDIEGRLELTVPDQIRISVEEKDIDVEELKEKIADLKEELEASLASRGCEDLKELQEKLSRREELEQDVREKKTRIQALLESSGLESRERLEEKLESYRESDNPFFQQLDNLPDQEELEHDLEEILKNKESYIEENRDRRGEFALWQEEYESFDEVLDARDEIREKFTEVEERLPEDFEIEKISYSSLEEVRQEIENFEDKRKKLEQKCSQLEEEIRDLEGEQEEMPAGEELNTRLQECRGNFTRLKKKGKALRKIQREFQDVKEEIDASTFDSLQEKFAGYLSAITGDRYKIKRMNSLGINSLIKEDVSQEFPVSLLSAGTEDSTALALRLAMLEDIFAEDETFLVMDEPLINLDYTRKKRAAELIAELAGNYQVLIFSCDRDTRDLLEEKGRLIELEERR